VRATELEHEDPIVRDRILAKRRIALLFYESSTRTRTSFELASKRWAPTPRWSRTSAQASRRANR
jgi:aspartate carbamoyltransferase catalytic subunit